MQSRTPVNDPGPLAVAKQSIWLRVAPHLARAASIIWKSKWEWPSVVLAISSATVTPARLMATLA
jgi:hypothetical protein